MTRVMTRPIITSKGNMAAQSKLQYVSDKLGLGGIAGMQGSTRTLFDTVLLSTNTVRQTLNFFSSTNNKSRNFTNFQNGKLAAGEAMVIETIAFYLVTLSGSDLASDSTYVGERFPFSQVNTAIVQHEAALSSGIMNLQIANSTVIKDFVLNETNPNFNPKTTGIAPGGILDSNDTEVFLDQVVGQATIYTESSPVLPPNQGFQLTVELPPVGTVAANTGIVCVIGRFGSIFAAKTTL